ncbi:MAG TPA: transporter associated domain-containing protein [Gemmatimonadaceae bacterium]
MRWLNKVAGIPAADRRPKPPDASQGVGSGLRGHKARDVMRPRTEIVAIAVDAPADEVRRIVRSERYSRYPVYRSDLDDVMGVFLAKDMWQYEDEEDFALANHVRKVPYVPDTRDAEHVLEDLRKARAHMAVVLDEYGGTAGIVTLEDLIEQVIGDISDEYDSAARLSVETDGVLELDATMSLADARSDYAIEVAEGDWNTVGGFVFGHLGRLPHVGDRVPMITGQLEVVAMDGRRVAAVRVLRARRPEPSQASR